MEKQITARDSLSAALGHKGLSSVQDIIFDAMLKEVEAWDNKYHASAARAIAFGYNLAIQALKGKVY